MKSNIGKMLGGEIYMYMMGGVCVYDIYDSIWKYKGKGKMIKSLSMIWIYSIIWNVSREYWKYGMIYLVWDVGNECLTAFRNKFIKDKNKNDNSNNNK